MLIDQLTLWIAGAVAVAIIAGLVAIHQRVAAMTEAQAAPRRLKPEEDHTVIDRLIIEADKRVDAINIQQFEGFLTDFVKANLDTILRKAPVIGPMATAADYLDPVFEAFQRRNPDLARTLNPSRETMQERLAGAIGGQTKDALAEALRDAIARGQP